MPNTYLCKKCGEWKERALMCGTRSDAQCKACKTAYKHGHYLRHSMSQRRNASKKASIMDRLRLRTSNMGKLDVCWLWQGAKDFEDGYGKLTIKGQQYRVHILMWEETYGPIPDGLYVLHNCPGGDTKNCLNPQHLWLGTQRDNILDSYHKGHRTTARLSPDDIRTIRTLATRTTQAEIARLFDIDQGYVSQIIHGKRRTKVR